MKKQVQKSKTKTKKAPPAAHPKKSAKPATRGKVVEKPVSQRTKPQTKKDDIFRVTVLTPKGRFTFPRLKEPNAEDAEIDAGKYTTGFAIKAEDLKNTPAGKRLTQGILEVARAYYKDDSLTLNDFDHPLKNMDKVKDKVVPEYMKGHYVLTAKSKDEPVFVGNKKNENDEWEDLHPKKIAAIKGGDWGRLVISIYPYNKAGNEGVGFGLENVQFIEAGEAFGGSKRDSLSLMEEAEVELDDPEAEEEEDTEEETEESDDDEEETEEDDSEDSDEDDSEDSDEDSSDDDDDF